MCAHYESVKDPERLQRNFGVNAPDDLGKPDVWPGYLSIFIRRPKQNDHPGQAAPAREAMLGSFGLIPHWAKDATIARHTYNARSETVAEKPSYRDAWRLGRHCIIPVEAFYEPDWRSGKAVATRISRADGKPMGLAGIWDRWTDQATGEIVASFSMLTINADEHPIMGRFHRPGDERRSLVVVPSEKWTDWLFAKPETAGAMLVDIPVAEFTSAPDVEGPGSEPVQGALL